MDGWWKVRNTGTTVGVFGAHRYVWQMAAVAFGLSSEEWGSGNAEACCGVSWAALGPGSERAPPPSNLWAVAMAVLLRILMIEEKCGFSVAASGMHVQLLILKCVKQRPVKVRSTLQRQLRYLVFAGDKCEATAAWEHCRAGLSFHLCTQLWACWTTLMTK